MAPPTLTDDWLDTAASYGATKWLQQFIRSKLLFLTQGHLSPEEFAGELQEEFDSRGLTTPAQQKNYRSNVVMALKQLDPDHPAIALVGLTTEQYRVLNDRQKGRVADRATRFIDQVETLVETATALLASEEWADVGAGLAVPIGRRISEIILSTFELKTSWSLSFSQMAKKADEVDITIEIPTLAPAEVVLDAIERLQRHLDGVSGSHTSNREAKRIVNNRYSGAISEKCAEHFGITGLVPNRSDKDNLYTHIFRAVYATIAAHWYCPPTVPEHQFKAEIQGHFSIAQDGKKLPNYSARSNYDDYAIGDGHGNRDGRLGIKLGQIEGLDVIEVFREQGMNDTNRIPATYLQAEEEHEADQEAQDALERLQALQALGEAAAEDKTALETPKTMTEPKKPALKRPALYADDLDLMNRIMGQRDVTGSPAELFRALLENFISEAHASQKQQAQSVGEMAQTLNWFTSEIEDLRGQIKALEQERDRSTAQQVNSEEMEQLKKDNQRLKQELQNTQARLNSIQRLLGGGSTIDEEEEEEEDIEVEETQEEEGSTRQRDRSESTAKITDVIDAIIKWNTAQERSDLRLRISYPAVKSLALLMGAGYQPAIKEVVDGEKGKEIDAIHQHYMIGSRHNRSVQDKDKVLQNIARDYLGLNNWQEAKYTT